MYLIDIFIMQVLEYFFHKPNMGSRDLNAGRYSYIFHLLDYFIIQFGLKENR